MPVCMFRNLYPVHVQPGRRVPNVSGYTQKCRSGAYRQGNAAILQVWLSNLWKRGPSSLSFSPVWMSESLTRVLGCLHCRSGYNEHITVQWTIHSSETSAALFRRWRFLVLWTRNNIQRENPIFSLGIPQLLGVTLGKGRQNPWCSSPLF